jgi:RimJ/RimL family protein N-acetyltransferase
MAEKKPAPPTQPSFIGEKVYLRPMTAEDVANTHHWFVLTEPQSQTCHPLTITTAAEASEAFKKQERNAEMASLMIVRIADNMPVGRVRYFNWNNLNRSVELGILIDPDEREKGYAKEGIRIVMRYLFKHRNLNKVHAQTSMPNIGAIKLLESLGFKRDGVLRRHYFLNGEFQDGLIYSKLAFEME